MNKYITKCPRVSHRLPTNKHHSLQIIHMDRSLHKRQQQISHNYLNVPLPQPRSPDGGRYEVSRQYSRQGEVFNVRKIKQQARYKRKKLLIEDEEPMRKESNSLVMHKSYTEQQTQNRSSSQKKTNIYHAFQVITLPKKLKLPQTKQPVHNDRQGQLIRSILRRYQDHHTSLEVSDRTNSPCISSLKLSHKKADGSKLQKIKFFGTRGCPPSKAHSELHQKKQALPPANPKTNPQIPKLSLYKCEDISPWNTEQTH